MGVDLAVKELFFPLLRSAVCGYTLTEAEMEAVRGADAAKLRRLAETHALSHLLSYALDKNGLADAEGKNEIFMAAYRCEQLNYELESLCAVLEDAKIPFIPLKGSVIRRLYPEQWMRNSGDIDVLVKESELDAAITALVGTLGYEEGSRWTHDVSLYSPSGVHVELHFNLVEDSYAQKSADVLASVWESSFPASYGSFRLEMSDEMFYLYHIAHMAKHFEHGGCGIRPFIDIWVLENRVEYDRSKRDALLEAGGLLKFAEACRKLTDYWFNGAAADSLTEQMAEFILRGGVYGSIENTFAAKKSAKGGRVGYILSRAFPSLSALQPRFPTLKKYPILLPVFWVYRVILMIKRGSTGSTARELKMATSISSEKAKSAAEFMEKIGL